MTESYKVSLYYIFYIIKIKDKALLIIRPKSIIETVVTDLIKQVSQLLKAELKELVNIARTTIEPIEPYNEEW